MALLMLFGRVFYETGWNDDTTKNDFKRRDTCAWKTYLIKVRAEKREKKSS